MIAYDRLSQIIPGDIALANEALKISLMQIAGISNMDLPTLANTVSQVQTAYNLPLINQQTQPISGNTSAYYLNVLGAYGTGECNSILTVDMLGTAIGTVNNKALANVTNALSTMNTVYLANCYSTMLDCINGVFNQTDGSNGYVEIPVGYPAAGDYDTIDDAFTGNGSSSSGNIGPGPGLIPVSQIEIGNLGTAYPRQVAVMNNSFDAICQQMGNEQDLQVRAGLDWSNYFANLLPRSQTAVMSFIFSLPGYGQDTIQGGAAEFLQGIADYSPFVGNAIVGNPVITQVSTFAGVATGEIISGSIVPANTTIIGIDTVANTVTMSQQAANTAANVNLVAGGLGGQAVIAVMRQGQNQTALNNAGILTNSDVPVAPNPPPPQANLYTSTYTAQQAANSVIV
jgi:hypothetical protein